MLAAVTHNWQHDSHVNGGTRCADHNPSDSGVTVVTPDDVSLGSLHYIVGKRSPAGKQRKYWKAPFTSKLFSLT